MKGFRDMVPGDKVYEYSLPGEINVYRVIGVNNRDNPFADASGVTLTLECRGQTFEKSFSERTVKMGYAESIPCYLLTPDYRLFVELLIKKDVELLLVEGKSIIEIIGEG